jgi:hypothetical protein
MLKPIVTGVLRDALLVGDDGRPRDPRGLPLVTIGALKVYIALKPIIDRIKQLAQSKAFITGLKVVFIALAVAVAAIAAPFVIGIGLVLVLVAVFGALVAAVAYVIGAIVEFVSGAASALAEWVSGAASAAANFVAGLVQGIVSGAGAVVSAVKGLASSALGAFTSALGIASPSKIMLEHGEDNIAGAVAIGTDKGKKKVDKAMSRLGTGEPGSPKGKGGGSGGGRGKIADKIEINFYGSAKDFPDFEEQAKAWLERLDAEVPS